MTAPWCSPVINERSIHYSICSGMTNRPQRHKQGLCVRITRTCVIHELLYVILASISSPKFGNGRYFHLCSFFLVTWPVIDHNSDQLSVEGGKRRGSWGWGMTELSIRREKTYRHSTACVCACEWKYNTQKTTERPMCFLNNQVHSRSDKTTTVTIDHDHADLVVLNREVCIRHRVTDSKRCTR